MSSQHQKFPPLTSRELADKIDDLIKLRIHEANNISNPLKAREEAEVVLRQLADAFKRLDHNGGIYVESPVHP